MRLSGLFSVLLLFCINSYGGAFAKFEIRPVLPFTKLHNYNDRMFIKTIDARWNSYALDGIYHHLFDEKISKRSPQDISGLGPRVLLSVKPLHVNHVIKNPNRYYGNVTIRFFGAIVAFNIAPKLQNISLHVNNNKDIIKFFTLTAGTNYSQVISRVLALQKQMRLNDWGTFLLVHKLANKLFSKNAANVFTCFILNKLHFNVKTALLGNKTALLIQSKNKLYNHPFYDIDHKKYYLFLQQSKESKIVFTYPSGYPGAVKPFGFALKRLPVLPFKAVRQKVVFNYKREPYDFVFTYNKNILDFLDRYPQTNISVYLHAPMSKSLYHQVVFELAQYINGMRASRAMNFVLLFMQHILAPHNHSVGADDLMFGQQTLYYGSLNSFNRSVLFAYVMRRLFNVAVGIAVYKHYATALVDIPMKGYGFDMHGRHFVVADPSFINGNLGQCRPKYLDIKPVGLIQL